MTQKTLTTLARKKLVVAALEDIKARDIVAIDVRRITSMFDWIVVASADSARQTKSLARHVRDRLKEAGCTVLGTEGEEGGEWVLVDSGDIVTHIMQPAVRAYYNLEELWGEGKFDRPANPAAAARLARASEEMPAEVPVTALRVRRAPAQGPRKHRSPASASTAPRPRRRKPAA
jgi:ribosome-associated protein